MIDKHLPQDIITALLISIPDGVVMFDDTKQVLLANPAAIRFTGLPQEGYHLSELYKLFSSLNLEKKIDESIKENRIIHIEEASLANLFLEIFLVPVKQSQGKIIGGVIILHDITYIKEAEKLRTNFLTLASHQLKTPLLGTKWLIETIQRGIMGKIKPKEKEYLDKIYQVNERMIQLVSEMLKILRLESKNESIAKESVLISDLFKDIFVSMAAVAESRKIILHNTLKDHKTATVETNLEILKSILECFISNAINYSKNGQEVILNVKEEPTAVVFSVKDSGIGIPKNEQAKMFERFYRASNAKAFMPGGTGLGLNIAKTLAEKIGAEISFESEENKGSTFYLRIPRSSGAAKTISNKI